MPTLQLLLIAFAAGTLALQWQPELPAVDRCAYVALAFAGAGGAARWCAARLRRDAFAIGRVTGITLLALATACAGFGYAAWRAQQRMADELPQAWEGVDIAMIGIVDELPSASPRGTRFAFAVERVLTSGATVPSRLSLAWFPSAREGPSDVPALRAAERWRMTVRLKRPHGTVNPHGFDVEAWLLQNELRATGYVRSNRDNVRLEAFAGRPTDYVQRARERVRERALRALGDAPYAGVIVALAIGEQRGIPERQWLVFNRTGITHLISISGLHVTVFASLAAALAFALARRNTWLTTRCPARRIAAAAGALAAFAYVLLAGAQIPAQRTFIMLAVAAVGLWLGRQGTARVIWLWALGAVLAFDPWAGLTPGFWLSFGAVGLLLYTGTGRLHSQAVSRLDALRRVLRAATQAQIVVTVGLVPLTLAVFQQVSLVAPLANAIAIPVVTFVVVPLALGAIALPFAWPWQLAHAVFAALMGPLDWLAALPGRTWEQHAPAAWALVAGMAGVMWLLAPRGVPMRALGLLWLLPLFTERPPAPEQGSVRITVLDVGQGLATVVQTHAHALLYDTGPRYNDDADAGSRIVTPFLRAAGIGRLDALVVSHLDTDHSGGTSSLLQTVPVERVLTSVAAAHPMFASARAPPDRCVSGASWEWDGVRFTVLHPPPEWYAERADDSGANRGRLLTNDLSCVLRVDAGDRTVLLTGDIEARSEAAMLARDALRPAQVVVVPHHGSRTSSTTEFVASVAPRIAVFTPGYRNRFGHPRAEVVTRYEQQGSALARTDLQGAITIDVAPAAPLHWRGQRDVERRYWYDAPRAAAAEERPP